MEWTLATILEFLRPMLDAYDFDPNDVMEVTFRPGGAEIVTYAKDSEGQLIVVGDEIRYNTNFVRYNRGDN